jgi:diguanylate cyclase (GGDEF)-like protein
MAARSEWLRGVAPLGVLLAGLAGLVAADRWLRPGEPVAPAAGALTLILLIVLAALAGAHAPLGPRTLGFAAVALAPAAAFYGPAAAGWVGGLALLACEALRRNTSYRRVQSSRVWLVELTGRVGMTILACLAAGVAWQIAAHRVVPQGARGLALVGGVATLGYLATIAALESGLGRATRAPAPLWRRRGLPLLLDVAGWLLGLLVVLLAPAVGWGVTLTLLAAFALLSLEAARLDRRRALAERRTRELREVTLAGNRINVRQLDLLGIAEEIHRECRRVVPFHWFQLELLAAGGGRSWWAGPELLVQEGEPSPPPAPPTLPGIHRRSAWKVLARELATEDEALAQLRLWCDPRRVRADALELLDTLMPQMTASLARALLGRLALRDPLTDLPDRRAFESHLERVFHDAHERGSAMAVVMCDVDNFKKINDLHGHATGDQALLLVARLLESHRRESDLCCRLGGDEFAVVLEGTDGETALQIAERIRLAVAQERRGDVQTRIPLRLTAGIAAMPELPVRAARDLLELADEALYEAKRKGRNRCLLHLGRGRFRTPDGAAIGGRGKAEAKPPTLFS